MLGNKKDPKSIFARFVKELSEPKQVVEGQHWLHELPKYRDWEVALNVIHLAIKSKPYYVGIVTNTRRKLNGLAGLSMFKKQEEELSEELLALLNIKDKTFSSLTQKIYDKSATTSANKDVWQFTTPWKEFAEGTKVIEIHKELEAKQKKKQHPNSRAYIILDMKCSTAVQNQILFIIHKVFEDEKNVKKILKLAALEFVSKPTRQVRKKAYTGRTPGRLVIQLKQSFKNEVGNVTPEELDVLLRYFRMLGEIKELSSELRGLEKRLRDHFQVFKD